MSVESSANNFTVLVLKEYFTDYFLFSTFNFFSHHYPHPSHASYLKIYAYYNSTYIQWAVNWKASKVLTIPTKGKGDYKPHEYIPLTLNDGNFQSNSP